MIYNSLFEPEVYKEVQELQKKISKKQLRKIERAKLKKLGEANYFYPTTGKDCYHTDGFVAGKNGSAYGGGFTVYLNGKRLITEKIAKLNFTNNEAELLGVLYAIEHANEGDEIVTDSMNTLSWVRSGKPKARMDLHTQAHLAHILLHKKKINLYWRPREENQAGNYNEFEK